MSKNEQILGKLRGLNEEVRRQDRRLAEESRDSQPGALETIPPPQRMEDAVQLESIILKKLRPVLAIKNNTTELVFAENADSETWKERLSKAKLQLDNAIRAIGRIDLLGGRLDWVGTGWLVADNVLVTNRHVANEFAMQKGAGFIFRMGAQGQMSAETDFLQEIGNPATLVFKLKRPLHIEEEPGPDVSFFEIELTSGNAKLTAPIALADHISETENAATIGYPAYDSRIPDPDLMEKIYGNIYDKKRLAPGAVTKVEENRLMHNCTTLGGNSGSVVLDLVTGKALGLHFSGSFLATNYAVRADVLARLLERVRNGRTGRENAGVGSTVPVRSQRSVRVLNRTDGAASVTIPLTVTVSLGDARRTERPEPFWSAVSSNGEDDIDGEEARVSDYTDRAGYVPEFLGKKVAVDLPTVERDAGDILEYNNDKKSDHVLRYEHYSVVMSRSRRMCFFSGVNIDGYLSKKSARVAWKWDPRIPKSQQIMNECYGVPPKFSRGHMTRREDPGWGDAKTAKRGNEDSMHVTNTTPQMQAFNAPIWLALEDYALQHAREDEMKISVFTGPYFSKRDPVMYGVKIPLAFWKVIAFIHDDTGKLCATGYEMSQEKSLQPEEEFVFGAFTSPQLHIATQVPIRSIAARSGINFGKLVSVDPLADGRDGLEAVESAVPLFALEQIRFIS
jgi:endonuclease G, mitochondrial